MQGGLYWTVPLISVLSVKLRSLSKYSNIYFISEILCLYNYVVVGSLSFNFYLNAIDHISRLRFIEFTGSGMNNLQEYHILLLLLGQICTDVCIMLCVKSCPIYLINFWGSKFSNRSSAPFPADFWRCSISHLLLLHYPHCFSKQHSIFWAFPLSLLNLIKVIISATNYVGLNKTGEKPTVEQASICNMGRNIQYKITNTLEIQRGYPWIKTLEKVKKEEFDILLFI